MRRILPAVGMVVLLTACASEEGGDGAAGSSQGRDELAIDVDPGDGSSALDWTLVCGGEASGTHPDPAAACSHLQGMDDPFAALPSDTACTQQYGGPQTAHVTGVWAGRPVDLELSRTDGCRISQWDALVPVVPAAG